MKVMKAEGLLRMRLTVRTLKTLKTLKTVKFAVGNKCTRVLRVGDRRRHHHGNVERVSQQRYNYGKRQQTAALYLASLLQKVSNHLSTCARLAQSNLVSTRIRLR